MTKDALKCHGEHINRIIHYALYVLLSLAVLLGGAYLLRTDPILMVPEKQLSGEEHAYPENWAFTDKHMAIKVETNPEEPHSVTTLCFIRDGKLTIPAMDGHTKRWPRYAEHDQRVRIKVGDQVYRAKLTLVTKNAKPFEIGPYLAPKMKDSPLPDPDELPQNIWLFEVARR